MIFSMFCGTVSAVLVALSLHDALPISNASGDGLEIEAKVFIDATYEGDLMAKAGVSYAVGRESAAQYGEPLNGVRAKTPLHQFLTKVDPYVTPGDPGSGLVPLIQSGDG